MINLFFCRIVAQWRYAEDGGPNQHMRKVIPQIGPVFMWFIRRQMKKLLYDQGIGRHTIDEINQIAEQNVTALSDFLGKTIDLLFILQLTRSTYGKDVLLRQTFHP